MWFFSSIRKRKGQELPAVCAGELDVDAHLTSTRRVAIERRRCELRHARVPVVLDEKPVARLMRADLRGAGVSRAELYARSASRLPVGVHDIRTTFVTSALANGKTETAPRS